MKNIFNLIKPLVVALVLTIGLSYVFAWTGPTGAPPTNNAEAPINVSLADQIKGGSLSLGGLFVGGLGLSNDDFCLDRDNDGVNETCLSTVSGGSGGGGSVSAVSGFPNHLVCSDTNGTLVFNILGQQGAAAITYGIETGAVVYSYYTAGDIGGSRSTNTQSIWFHSNGTYGGVNAYSASAPGGSACVNKNIDQITGYN